MKTDITPLQDRDAGLALAFLFLLLWLFFHLSIFIYLAMATLILAMVWAKAMRPFAIVWFGIAKLLGGIVSRILLAVVWLGMVVPVGVIRRWAGKDNLKLKKWHHGDESVFVSRNHTYTSDDLKNPY